MNIRDAAAPDKRGLIQACPPPQPADCLAPEPASLWCLPPSAAYAPTRLAHPAAVAHLSPPYCHALQPLLKRYQAQRCSYAVFALPAVQAVIKFK